jgi:hypothetical protein
VNVTGLTGIGTLGESTCCAMDRGLKYQGVIRISGISVLLEAISGSDWPCKMQSEALRVDKWCGFSLYFPLFNNQNAISLEKKEKTI